MILALADCCNKDICRCEIKKGNPLNLTISKEKVVTAWFAESIYVVKKNDLSIQIHILNHFSKWSDSYSQNIEFNYRIYIDKPEIFVIFQRFSSLIDTEF